MNALLVAKQPVATRTALAEFTGGAYNTAGPNEKLLVAIFLSGVQPIPDTPSARVMNLNIQSKSLQKKLGYRDRVILGTGDALGIQTITSDGTFVQEANKQGVLLWVRVIYPAPRYGGI